MKGQSLKPEHSISRRWTLDFKSMVDLKEEVTDEGRTDWSEHLVQVNGIRFIYWLLTHRHRHLISDFLIIINVFFQIKTEFVDDDDDHYIDSYTYLAEGWNEAPNAVKGISCNLAFSNLKD